MNAETFNARYPVGTPVLAYPGIRPEDPVAIAFQERANGGRTCGDSDPCKRLVTRTRTPAWTLGHGEPVVSVDGYPGGIVLEHVDVISEEQFAKGRAEETAAAVAALGALPVPVGVQPQPLTDEFLATVQARAEAATPGPWCTDGWEIYQGTEYEPGISPWIGETCRGVTTQEQDRADATFVAAARTDVPLLLTEVAHLKGRIADLEEQRERRRLRLIALQNDAMDMRGSLAPNGEDNKVPFLLGETLTPAVDWLIARVTELEVAAIEGRSALAALCHDLDDPGSMALGALYLLQQATPGVPMDRGETVPKVYRASHDSIVMGLYLTEAEARKHCETLIRQDIPGASLDWIEDEEDGVAELVAAFGEDERSTGYVVTALEVASEYDEEADE